MPQQHEVIHSAVYSAIANERHPQPEVAELFALRAGRAGEPRQDRPGYQPGGFHLVHDGDFLGPRHEETAARLMVESTKARENGEACALLKAQNAAAANERRERSRA